MIGQRLPGKRKKHTKICVLIDAWEPVWGGGQTHVWEISKRLVQDFGYEVDIYTRKLISTRGKKYNRNENHLNNRLKIFRIGPATNFYNIFGRVCWLLSVIITVFKNHPKRKYSIIHAHAYIAGLPAKILSLFIKLPVIFTVHGCNNLDLGRLNLTTYIENILLTKIKYDIEISVGRNFLKHKNVNNNIFIVPNGVNIKAFDQAKSGRLRPNILKILWVGRYDKMKGLGILINAYANILKINKNFELFLVGDGPEKNNISKLIDALCIRNYVKIINKKKYQGLIKIYKSADIFILTSLSEGQPVTILEAWAAGLPVIATDVGDNRYFIKNQVNGWLIKPDSVSSIIQALIEAKDSKKLIKMGKSGYQLVKKYYSWELTTQKIHRIYQKLT